MTIVVKSFSKSSVTLQNVTHKQKAVVFKFLRFEDVKTNLSRCQGFSLKATVPPEYEEQITNGQSSYLFHLECNLFFT